TFTLCNGTYSQASSYNFELKDASGTGHPFLGSFTYGPCNVSGGFTAVATDGSGYTLVATPNGEAGPSLVVYDRSGNNVPIGSPGDDGLVGRYSYGGQVVDPDGVTMSVYSQQVDGQTA